MAAALVQTGTAINISGGTSGNITLTSVAAGNLLVVYADDIDGASATFSVSDDKGNTWASAVFNDNGGYTSAILYCLNAAAGTTVVTITASTSTSFLGQAQEFSGGTWSLDTTSFIDEGSTTSHVCSASSSVIDTTGEDVVICNSTTNDGGNFGTRTAGSGYTGLSSPTAQAFWQYQIFSTAQANERGAWTSANSKGTAACIAAFKLAASDEPLSLIGYCIERLTGCWWPKCKEVFCYYYYGVTPGPPEISCCPCPGTSLPDTLVVTLASDCACLDGLEFTMYRSPFTDPDTQCSVYFLDPPPNERDNCTSLELNHAIPSCGSNLYILIQLEATCNSSRNYSFSSSVAGWDGVSLFDCLNCCPASDSSVPISDPGNSCSPFMLTISTTTSGGCQTTCTPDFSCSGGYSITFTITEA